LFSDLVEASVSSTALDNLEQTLQDVGSNLEIVIADRQENLVELKKQKNNISRKVKEKREEIKNFLDKLELCISQVMIRVPEVVWYPGISGHWMHIFSSTQYLSLVSLLPAV
jgi:glycine cleavage system regulatory protein